MSTEITHEEFEAHYFDYMGVFALGRVSPSSWTGLQR